MFNLSFLCRLDGKYCRATAPLVDISVDHDFICLGLAAAIAVGHSLSVSPVCDAGC